VSGRPRNAADGRLDSGHGKHHGEDPITGVSLLAPRTLGEAWFSELPPTSRAEADRIYKQKVARNLATGVEDCLYFKDWLHLTARCQPLVQGLGYSSRRSFEPPFPERRLRPQLRPSRKPGRGDLALTSGYNVQASAGVVRS
jgi:hypothetical protein